MHPAAPGWLMWMFLAACTALEALTLPEVELPTHAPTPVREGSIGYAVIVESPGEVPWGEELPQFETLSDGLQPLQPYSVSAAILLDPSHPWLLELLVRASDDDRYVSMLNDALTTTGPCEVALAHAPKIPWEALLYCPYAMRSDIHAAYSDVPEAMTAFARPTQPDALAAAYTHGDIDAQQDAFLHPEAHDRVAKAAERCIEDRNEQLTSCVGALAQVGWERAVPHADHLDNDDPLREALEAYATEEALDARLHDLGFSDANGPGDTIRRLWRGGYVYSPGDAPLAELLRMVGVQGIQLAGHLSDNGDRTTYYAYANERRTRLLTDATRSFEVEQQIGFANRLARGQERPLRALWVEDRQWGWLAIVGPTDGLEALVAEGLVVVPDSMPAPVPNEAPLVDTAAAGLLSDP